MENYSGNSHDHYDHQGRLIGEPEFEPPHPNDRPRCWKGHFLKVPIRSRGWKVYYKDDAGFESADSGPHYRPAQDGEKWDEFEIYCPACDAWGQF